MTQIYNDAIELVQLSNNFYRSSCKRMIRIIFAVLISIGVSTSAIIYLHTHQPEPRYFPTTPDGRILPIFPLSEAMLSPDEVLEWAQHAAMAAYSYDFVNYLDAMQQMHNQFTFNGWKYYENALKTARTLEMVKAKKLVVSSIITGASAILDQSIIRGKYSWKVQIPLLVTYESVNEQTQQPMTVTMTISRVPTIDMPKGIAIVSLVSQAA